MLSWGQSEGVCKAKTELVLGEGKKERLGVIIEEKKGTRETDRRVEKACLIEHHHQRITGDRDQ